MTALTAQLMTIMQCAGATNSENRQLYAASNVLESAGRRLGLMAPALCRSLLAQLPGMVLWRSH